MLKLASRLAWRDWRGGELHLLIVALILAITSLGSISLFTERVQQTMQAQGSTLLAADLRLNSSQNITPEWLAIAQEKDLLQARISRFQGMVYSNEQLQLASIKAVSDRYPLKGTLQVSSELFGQPQTINQGPKPGNIWLDSRLAAILNVGIEDTVDVGEAQFTISHILISEPDRVGGFAGFAPRALINLSDLQKTKLIKQGSRIRHSWLLAGDNEQLNNLQEELTPLLVSGQSWRSPSQANDNISDTLERAEQFLLLSSSLTIMLAGIALVLSARRYSMRQAKHVALLKCLGLKPKQLSALYLVQMLLLAVAAIIISLPIIWSLHWLLLQFVSDYLKVDGALPIQPFVLGALIGLVCLLAFVMPAMFDLTKVTPVNALRQSNERTVAPVRHWLIGLAAMLSIVLWQSKSLLITLGLVAAIASLSLLLLLSSFMTLWLTNKFKNGFGKATKLGVANLQRRRKQNSGQIIIFSMALMLLFSLLGVRNFLISDWQNRLDTDTPNIFMLNIFDEQRNALDNFVIDNNISEDGVEFFPVTRGRFVEPSPEVLEQVSRNDYGPPADRENNLTWSEELPADNIITAGEWWSPDTNNLQVSVEEDYAYRFAFELGDYLTFNVSGIEHKAQITSFRKVDWSGLKPNFFLVFSQPLSDENSSTYLASMFIDEDKRPNLSVLLRQYPTISVIDVEQILDRVKAVVTQLSLAIESILLLMLVAATLVLIASIQASRHERVHESAILRTIGASRSLIQKILMVEYLAMGTIAGILAGGGAETLLAVIQIRLFQLPFQWHWELWVLAPLSGAFIIGLTGWWFNRSVVFTPPLRTLRNL